MRKVYLILAALMLLCLAPMPYGYFQLVRFLSTLVFGVMAFHYYKERKEWLAYTCGILALLFQPFYKIALGRTVWNIVDVIVAIGLIALFIYEWKRGDAKAEIKRTTPPINIIGEQVESNSFEFTLQGELGPKELVYVASEEDKELNDLFEAKPEVFEGWGQMMGFRIIYLPLLMKRLQEKRVLQYRAPYLSDTEVKSALVGNDFLLRFLDNPADRGKIRHGFIRTENIHRGNDGKDKAINRFYPLSSKSGEPIADQLHRISKQIAAEDSQKKLIGRSYDDWGDGVDVSDSPADSKFNSQQDGEDINDLMEEIRERIIKLRQRGIAEYLLEQLIHPDNRLSRMVITKDYRILLPDYNDMEIKMEPLVKAVYLLFLKHPEGIAFKCLSDYREELARVYTELRPAGLTDKALQSIEDVTNPLLNSINEKCARIRGAFVGQFDDYMARNYYIDGQRGEAKKIALPRNLVVWE
jgi:hypothetical protein